MNTTSQNRANDYLRICRHGVGPDRVSTGTTTYLVDDGLFEAPVRFAQALRYLHFETRGPARVKPKAKGMGEDKSKEV